MVVRPYEARDRARAIALLKDPRAIDSPGNRIVVADDAEGLALWLMPDAGHMGELATVLTPEGDRRLFYELARMACEHARAAGLSQGRFTIRDQRLLHRLQHDFRIDPAPSGWQPNTGRPTRWTVEVDLEDAWNQLNRVLAAPQRQVPHA